MRKANIIFVRAALAQNLESGIGASRSGRAMTNFCERLYPSRIVRLFVVALEGIVHGHVSLASCRYGFVGRRCA
jgi:hypothetical protein